VSIATGGGQSLRRCGEYGVTLSVADGRFVAFESDSTDLVPGDSPGTSDIFLHDRQLGTTEVVSISSTGQFGAGDSLRPSISADGRFIAFTSLASNLVSGDTNVLWDIFVHDRNTGTTERISVGMNGAEADGDSTAAAISADGRFVAFNSRASNLVAGPPETTSDIFVRDLQLGVTQLVSVSSTGVQANDDCLLPVITSDGRYVVFQANANNLVPGDTNGVKDVFVRNRQLGTTERASIGLAGAEGNSESALSSVSSDGRYVAFTSAASNLVANDTNGTWDIFVRDRQAGETHLISGTQEGASGNNRSLQSSISADGRYVVFGSEASDLVSNDSNGKWDTFVRDRLGGSTELLSVSSSGMQGDGDSGYPTDIGPSFISMDGRYVVFLSQATNLVAGDTNQVMDVFVRDRGSQGLTSMCDPGGGGAIACPCLNPPSGLGRGCDNSQGTGGAILAAAGFPHLAADGLVFTTSGQRSRALSIVAQWIGFNPTGIVFGMGVRCTSGTFKRLFSKNAVGGSITAPDFTVGDPTVSARSAEKGDIIQPGQSRWYLVYYRDPIVLGGCPASSTFNATQTGQVTWSP
jgi:Tol biopolymer transport system component